MAEQMLFYYLGDDQAYYKALQGEFKQNAKIQFDFQRHYESSESRIQSLFQKIYLHKPACVFIDISKNTQDYLHLARLISRTNFEHEMVVVSLLDYLSSPEILRESILTGAHLNFIKSAETFDVAFSVATLVTKSTGEHGFANAAFKEDFPVGVLCKVGFVDGQGLHIETNESLSKGDRISMNHHWLEKRVVPSKQMFVKEVDHTNMFYQFKKNADLEFIFVDEFLPSEGMEADVIKQKTEERAELISYHKKQLKKWIADNQSNSSEKRTKVLVVDEKFHFYADQPRTDKHGYTIRCIPYFRDIKAELDRLKPQIIAFEIQTERNTLADLHSLVQAAGALKPFIIVFNSPQNSAELQAVTNYPQMIAHQDELSPEIVIRMADALQKKLSGGHSDVPKVFLKKNQPMSVAEIHRTVTLIKISETDMVFQSPFSFETGANLHFTEPVEMYVTVLPAAKPSGKTPEYYGLIHSLGETDKKELRRYVNTLFFREHDAALATETAEFKKLNEAKLSEKIALELEQKKVEEAGENSKDPEAGQST